MRGISWLAENCLAFQEELCCMESVSQALHFLLTLAALFILLIPRPMGWSNELHYPGIKFWCGWNFSYLFILALGSTQSAMQCILCLSQGYSGWEWCAPHTPIEHQSQRVGLYLYSLFAFMAGYRVIFTFIPYPTWSFMSIRSILMSSSHLVCLARCFCTKIF
jgi:hypothetical protein